MAEGGGRRFKNDRLSFSCGGGSAATSGQLLMMLPRRPVHIITTCNIIIHAIVRHITH